FTRLSEKGPFYPPHVEKVVKMVTYGPVPLEKLAQVQNLVAEFTDIFALSIWEVKPVKFIKFRLNIPKDIDYPTKVNQKLLSQAQKEFYHPKLNEFIEAKVLRSIHSDEVKAAHPTVLAQKAH
ncbi:hypothetical protein BDN67DRAFT_858603, partial [Paxillus ammoniavirescens]